MTTEDRFSPQGLRPLKMIKLNESFNDDCSSIDEDESYDISHLDLQATVEIHSCYEFSSLTQDGFPERSVVQLTDKLKVLRSHLNKMSYYLTEIENFYF